MKTPRILLGALLALAATALTMGVAPSAQAAGTTSNTYTWYDFPAGTPGLHQVSWETTVLTDPGRSSHVFWSHQFNFTGTTSGAYTGMQTNGPGQTPVFLFSVWDATETKAGSDGSWCETFGNEGVGESCRINYDWTPGYTYRFTVADEGDQWFGATVTEVQTGISFKLGSIRALGATISPSGMVDWTEYYEWNSSTSTCENQPYSQARFGLPQGDGVTATIASTPTNGNCGAMAVSQAVDGGSLQTLSIGNSVRAQVTGPDGVVLAGAPGHDGAAKAAAPDSTSDHQFWVYSHDDTLQLADSGRCLYDDGSGNVTVQTCDGTAATHWTVADGTLVNAATGNCLTARPKSKKLASEPCNGSLAPRWEVPTRRS